MGDQCIGGHAVSTDLVHWEHLPIALYPDSLGYIFSGSAVVDWNNSSGLGTNENPPLIIFFTYHNPLIVKAGGIDVESQALAYSIDKGRTWIKYEGNPVIANDGKSWTLEILRYFGMMIFRNGIYCYLPMIMFKFILPII